MVLVLASLTGALSSCNRTVVSTQADPAPDNGGDSYESEDALHIGYSYDDSLNPYYAETDLNSDLTSLVFEPLFYLNDSFRATPSLAASYTLEDKALTVKIDTTAAFSDGVQISSADVVYSFNTAKESDAYRKELTCVTTASAVSADTVKFSLSGNYANAQDSLTFPIVKSGTAASADALPVGTGLYSYLNTEIGMKLKYNPYCRKPQPSITNIELKKIDASSTLVHTLELGAIDAFFDDLSSGSYSQANATWLIE